LYRTENAMLVPEAYYAAYGSGKTISDFLTDRLCGVTDQLWGHENIDNATMIAIAAFIFKEAEKSAGGVGFGMDMRMIRVCQSTPLRIIGSDVMKEIQDSIPTLSDALFDHWKKTLKIPRMLVE